MQRRRFKQTSPLDQRLEEQAKRLRKEARDTRRGLSVRSLFARLDSRKPVPIYTNGLCHPGCGRPSRPPPPADKGDWQMPHVNPATADRATWHVGQRVSRKNTQELGTVVEHN
jgi:hypothetical protein